MIQNLRKKGITIFEMKISSINVFKNREQRNKHIALFGKNSEEIRNLFQMDNKCDLSLT